MVQEHEQALISAIARLADASEFESGNINMKGVPLSLILYAMLSIARLTL